MLGGGILAGTTGIASDSPGQVERALRPFDSDAVGRADLEQAAHAEKAAGEA